MATTGANADLIDSLVLAYNSHDALAFSAHFSDDAYHGELHSADALIGREAIYERYVDVFRRFPGNATQVVHRVILDGVIVDHERVSRHPGDAPFDVVAVNTIRDNKIVRLEFIRNPVPAPISDATLPS